MKDIIKTEFTDKEPAFVKVYLKNVLALSDIKGSYNSLLYALLKRATYAGNGENGGMEVVLNSSIKKRIMEEIGVKNIGSIANGIAALVKGEILYRVDSGVFQLSPYIFGKGDWKEVSALRLTVEYREETNGKKIKVQTKRFDEDEFGEIPEDSFEIPYDLEV